MKEINLNHICKIEGHAHLSLKIDKNKVKECELKASEGARFFEGLVVGKKLEDVQEIVSRICGICSCSHSVVAVQALEEAIGMKPSKQQKIIREALILGERIRSHATHLYFLSLPDYFDASSVLSLGEEHKEKVNDALEIVSVGNKVVEIFGGREIHPFLGIREDLETNDFSEIINKLKNVKKKIHKSIKLFSSLKFPKIERDCDYLCLAEKNHYTSISGKIKSKNDVFIDDDYKKHLKENIKEYATSKFVLIEGHPYMLGAMARINTNYDKLSDEAKEALNDVLKKLKIKLPFVNPYHNIICQAIELLESVNRLISILSNIPKAEEVSSVKPKQGHGVSAVEAPRGTLFHEYKLDKEGKVTFCNIITPTAQNLNMMENDITILVDKLLEQGKSKEEIVDSVEKLIRAYDPCFSCSTHFLKVNWF